MQFTADGYATNRIAQVQIFKVREICIIDPMSFRDFEVAMILATVKRTRQDEDQKNGTEPPSSTKENPTAANSRSESPHRTSRPLESPTITVSMTALASKSSGKFAQVKVV